MLKIAALGAALAFALPARATQKMPAPKPARSPAAPSGSASAPRPASPSVASAAEVSDDLSSGWRFGPALGFEFGMGDLDYDAVKVRIEAERTMRPLSPVATLSFIASLSMTHPNGKKDIPIVIDPFFGTIQTATLEWDANVFELIPGARVTYAAAPGISLYADGGLGLVYTVGHVALPPIASGLRSSDVIGDGVGGVLRLAGGIVLTPTPALRVALEAVGLNIRFGDGPGTGFSLVASVSHRL